jgi:acetyltransferase EpsM
MNNVYLYGAGGHGKVVLDIVESLGIKPVGFVDINLSGQYVYNYPIFQNLPDGDINLIISIGNNETRKKIFKINFDKYYKSLIHPFSSISRDLIFGDGSIICKGVSVCPSVVIGSHVILNTNASIDHDCVIDDFVHLSPNVALSGGVSVGEGSHIGIGACVIPGIKIGKWAVIGAGAVIIDDVPDYAVVVGNPGKIIKYNKYE